MNVVVAAEVLVEGDEVVLLNVEVDLVHQCLLQRLLPHRDLEALPENRQELADAEQYIHISLDVLLHLGMPDLDGHFLALVVGPVDLAHRPRSDWLLLELGKDFLNVLAVAEPEVALSLLEAVFGCIFSQMGEAFSHLWANDVTSMTQVLESLYPNHSRPFHSLHE